MIDTKIKMDILSELRKSDSAQPETTVDLVRDMTIETITEATEMSISFTSGGGMEC